MYINAINFLFNQHHCGTNNLKLNYILRILHVDDNYYHGVSSIVMYT
jgi:hypothetical protein